LPGIAKKSIYTDILLERSALIDWAAKQLSAEVKADPVEAPLASEPKTTKTPVLDTAREAIAALWPTGVPTGLTYKEIGNQIRQWCKEQTPPRRPPSDRTIRRAIKDQ
jgi:hypothetical protein